MYVEFLSLLIAFVCVCCDKLCDAALLSVWWLHMNDLISWSATFLSEQLKYLNEGKAARSGAISSSDWSTDVFCRRCGVTTLLHVTTLPPCGSFIQLLHFTTLLKKKQESVFVVFHHIVATDRWHFDWVAASWAVQPHVLRDFKLFL